MNFNNWLKNNHPELLETVEFWPRDYQRKLQNKPPIKKRVKYSTNKRWPKLPIGAGKAQQMLSSAIIMQDHEMASWVDEVFFKGKVYGTQSQIDELEERLNQVMDPNSRQPEPIVKKGIQYPTYEPTSQVA